MRPDPTVLAFDTSAAHCAAALLLDGTVSVWIDTMQRGQAEYLIDFLTRCLAEKDLTFKSLDAICVGIGPGNFTGVRIAVSAARGLSLGLDIPAIGVGTLTALAFGKAQAFRATLPAPRDQHYAQDFDAGIAGPVTMMPGVVAEPDWRQVLPAMARIAATEFATRKQDQYGQMRPAPIYVRPADAAPASDPPPVILR